MAVFQKIIRGWHWLEDGVLVAVLLSMVVLAVAQIVLRNFFDSSLLWVDPVLRISVLWVGLLGSMIASRKNEHIAIDIASHYVPERFQRYLVAVIALFTLAVCSVVAYFSARFVYDEYVYESMAFGHVPAWIFQLIIPLAFAVMSLRYLLLFVMAIIDRLPEIEELDELAEEAV